jgi:hypothetical protein
MALIEEPWILEQRMQMFLPHLLDREEYRHYMLKADGYKLMDNGAAEGETYGFDALNSIAATFGINEVVIPDTIGDCDLTIDLARWAVRSHKPQGVKWMAVVQGDSPSTLLKCWRELMRLDYVDIIGVPRHINKHHPQARYQFLRSVKKLRKEDLWFKPIHALGSHSWLREVTALAELGIRSMDTSLPLHMAYLEQAMVTASIGVPRSPDYFDGRWNEGRRILGASNVDTFQHWAQA